MKTPCMVIAFFLLIVGIRGAETPSPRLNILFVFADDWGRYASAYRGLDGRPTLNDVIQTPHVDRVAREGVVFKNAFVNAPSCTPCRSSLLSGRHFFQTGRGAILQGAVWDATIPTFPLLLRDHGYHIGKSHKVWSPGTPIDAGFGGQAYAYQRAGIRSNNFSENVTADIAQGATLAEARARILAEVRGNFADFLAARKPGQPWLYWMGTTTTHRTWIKGSGKKLWGIEPDQLKGKLPRFLPDVPAIREDVADYLGECQAVDAYVGALLQSLEAAGELENTVIVLSGDHGMPGVPLGKCNLNDFGTAVPLIVRYPGAKPGRVIDDLVRLPDLMPTFLEIGHVTAPTGLYGVSLLPLLNSDQQGRVDTQRDATIAGRERHVGVARAGNLPYPMRSIRTHDFLYIRNFAPDRWPMGAPFEASAAQPDLAVIDENTRAAFPDMDASPTKTWLIAHGATPAWQKYYDLAFAKRPAEELYELKNDPDQIKNLADDPAYAVVRQTLSARLMATLQAAGDPRVLGDGATFDRSPFSDPEDLGAPKAGNAAKKKKA
jgi:arylsulfatase A-like enzyme